MYFSGKENGSQLRVDLRKPKGNKGLLQKPISRYFEVQIILFSIFVGLVYRF